MRGSLLSDIDTDTTTDDPWAGVVGQPAAVATLKAGVARPVHAYLLVGPRGSGKRKAAAVFAGEIIVSADAASDRDRTARHRQLASDEQHPDVVVVSPSGNALRRIDEVARLIVEASRTPVEGTRKVLVVDGFHTATAAAAAALLKPVEEPVESLVWVLLAEHVLPEHVTIASRCTKVEFAPLSDKLVSEALVSEGLADSENAELLAVAAAGNLRRARQLATDDRVSVRRQSWWSIPDRLDGSGATVALLVSEVRALISEAGEALEVRHREELVALKEHEDRYGIRGSGRKTMEARHKRELRQARTDEIRFGLATLAGRYRDQALASLEHPDTTAMVAIDRIRATSSDFVRNPNEALALQALLLDLPIT